MKIGEILNMKVDGKYILADFIFFPLYLVLIFYNIPALLLFELYNSVYPPEVEPKYIKSRIVVNWIIFTIFSTGVYAICYLIYRR